MAVDETERIAARGNWGTVEFAVRSDESMPAREFFLDLEPKVRTAAEALFQRMADHGAIHNPSRFKPEGQGIYAFKVEERGQVIRFPCFNRGRRWILTHGFQKRRQKWRPEDLQRALRIKNEHLAWEQAQQRHQRNGRSKKR